MFLLHLNRSINDATEGYRKHFKLPIFTEDIPNCASVCEYKTKDETASPLPESDRQFVEQWKLGTLEESEGEREFENLDNIFVRGVCVCHAYMSFICDM